MVIGFDYVLHFFTLDALLVYTNGLLVLKDCIVIIVSQFESITWLTSFLLKYAEIFSVAKSEYLHLVSIVQEIIVIDLKSFMSL